MPILPTGSTLQLRFPATTGPAQTDEPVPSASVAVTREPTVPTEPAMVAATEVHIKQVPFKQVELKARFNCEYTRCSDGKTVRNSGHLMLTVPRKKEGDGAEPHYGQITVSDPGMYNTFAAVEIAEILKTLWELPLNQKIYVPLSKMKQRIAILKQFLHDHSTVRETWNGRETIDSLIELAESLSEGLSAQVKADRITACRPAGSASYRSTASAQLPSAGATRGAAPTAGRLAGYANGSSASQTYNATASGAQGFEKMKEAIEKQDMTFRGKCDIETILKEIELQLEAPKCADDEMSCGCGLALIQHSGEPAKILAQMASSVSSNSHEKRPPALIHFLVDTSASMKIDAQPKSPKKPKTRSDLVKESLMRLILRLNISSDVVNITHFDTKPKVVHPTAPLEEDVREEMVIDLLNLKTEGDSTNLEKALDHAFTGILHDLSLMDAQTQEQCVPMVVIYTDAQANDGRIKPDDFDKMMKKASEKRIGLIIVGMGAAKGYDPGFNEELAKVLTKHRRSAYFYVSSEMDMDQFTENFLLYLKPYADDVTLSLDLEGMELEPTGTFTPQEGTTGLQIKIPTLFLLPKTEGGGAMLFQLKEKNSEVEIAGKGPVKAQKMKDTGSKVAVFIGNDGVRREFREGDHFTVSERLKFSAQIVSVKDDKIVIATKGGARQTLQLTDETARGILQAMRLVTKP